VREAAVAVSQHVAGDETGDGFVLDAVTRQRVAV
jgi:hypothetical protein